MRLNKFIAQHTECSRRAADELISSGRVKLNGEAAGQGIDASESDVLTIDGKLVNTQGATSGTLTVIFHKPVGCVCSRDGQGSTTIYELLPPEYQRLNSVGRLDKDSSGLLLLTSDGELANRLTHPRYEKVKVYEVNLDKPLQPLHQQMIADYGVELEDGVSKLQIEKLDSEGMRLQIAMREGRNRQIRRTFRSLGYDVTKLHRTVFGEYHLGDLQLGAAEIV